MDIKPSDEQKLIVDSIKQNNVVVNSVAGAGKTTTLIFIAKENAEKKILQITYNKQLKLEVRDKMRKYSINNVEIHTYHSLAVKYYDPLCFTDDNIINLLEKNKSIKNTMFYDMIVIDEVQDMTPNYYELVYKFMSDINFNGKILVLGDNYQGIYEFKNADTRFLTLSHKIWGKQFDSLNLHQSYRVTKQIAWFVNNVMLGNDRIISNKENNNKIYYYKKSIYNIHNQLFTKIKHFLKIGYKPEDLFILSPTLKSANNPVKKLENIMVKNNIPVYFSRNEEEGIDEKIIAGKAVFTTFHQSKGRERKIVFVFGFDDSYFDFFAQDKNRYSCPAELYVAVTRSSEILFIIEHDKNESLSFLKIKPDDFFKHSKYIEYNCSENKQNKKNKEKKIKEKIHATSVSELTGYLSEMTMREIGSLILPLFTTEKNSFHNIEIPSNVKMKNGLVEDVSDLNALIIPAIYEAHVTGKKSKVQKTVEDICENETKENKIYIENKKQELMKYQNSTIPIYLIFGNLYIALTENILSKLNQIDRYDWLTEHVIKSCHKNIKQNIKKDSEYEVNVTEEGFYSHKHKKYGTINISGRYDAINSECLWEIKCVNSINIEHMLQLLIYAWIYNQINKSNIEYKIINIRSGEVKKMEYNEYVIREITELIFINKYEQKIKDTDVLFLEKCKKIRRKYENNNAILFNQ